MYDIIIRMLTFFFAFRSLTSLVAAADDDVPSIPVLEEEEMADDVDIGLGSMLIPIFRRYTGH